MRETLVHFPARPGRTWGQELGLLQGVNGWLGQEGANRRCHSPGRHEMYQCFLPPSQDPTNMEHAAGRPGWSGVGWGGVGGMPTWIPGVLGRLQGREKLLSTPTSPSTHSLPVLPSSLLSDGYQSLGKCKRHEGGVDGRWVLSSSLPPSSRMVMQTPLPTTQLQVAKKQDPHSSPHPNSFKAITLPPVPSQETHGFAKPL